MNTWPKIYMVHHDDRYRVGQPVAITAGYDRNTGHVRASIIPAEQYREFMGGNFADTGPGWIVESVMPVFPADFLREGGSPKWTEFAIAWKVKIQPA